MNVNKMWCLMLQLSMNMWNDSPNAQALNRDARFELALSCDKKVWDEVTKFAANSGCNAILIDIGDGIQYQSHPEIAIEGAWSPDFLKKELKRLRNLGLTPYPKLNFSTGHDAWLKEYSRMVSTEIYYKVCKDIIHEVIELFDYPELFHLGMDEEDALNQQKLHFVCYRQFDLIWHDLAFLFNCVRQKGVRPWIWADYYWSYPDEFTKQVAKDVVLSPWYYSYLYGDVSAPMPTDQHSLACINSFRKLSELGYDVVAAGSNHANTFNFDHLVRFTMENVNPEHDKGLLITPWVASNDKYKYSIMEAIHLAKYVKDEFGL